MSGPKHLWSGDWERESANAARNRPEHVPTTDEPEVDPTELPPRRRRPSIRMVAIAAVTAILVAAVGVVLANALSGSTKPKPKPEVTGSVSPFPKSPGAGTHPRTTPNGSSAPGNRTPNAQSGPGGSQIGPGGSQSGSGGQSAPGGSQTAPNGGAPNAAGGQSQPPTAQFANQPSVDWLGMQIITSPTGAVVNTVQIGSQGDTAGFEPGDVVAAVAGRQITSARQIKAAVAHIPVGSRVSVEIARGSLLITMPVTMVDRPTVQP